MALWGTADSLYSVGTIEVDYAAKTIVGSGTSFTAAGISTGTVISIGAGNTFGYAVISGVTSDRFISIATTQYLSGTAIAGVAYTLSQSPIYVLEDSNYNGISSVGMSTVASVYGVDIYEQNANTVSGSKYQAAHAGWVGIHTYIDCHGTLRVKSETLVAMSGITTNGNATYTTAGDAADDAVYPDRVITFTTQPSNQLEVSVSDPVTNFTVVASADPSASLVYQWQYASSVGAAYTDLTNTGIYSDVTTATVGIGSTTNAGTRPDGFYYRVVVTADGGATATSDAARLTYA